MMESTEDWRRDQLAGTGDPNIIFRLGNRSVAIQALVWPGSVIVLLDEFRRNGSHVVDLLCGFRGLTMYLRIVSSQGGA